MADPILLGCVEWFSGIIVVLIIYRRQQQVARQLNRYVRPLDGHPYAIETILLVNDVSASTHPLICFVESLGTTWVAVHVAVQPHHTARVLKQWEAQVQNHGPLYVLTAPYGWRTRSIVQLVHQLKHAYPNTFINIIDSPPMSGNPWTWRMLWLRGMRFQCALMGMHGVAVTNVHDQAGTEMMDIRGRALLQ